MNAQWMHIVQVFGVVRVCIFCLLPWLCRMGHLMGACFYMWRRFYSTWVLLFQSRIQFFYFPVNSVLEWSRIKAERYRRFTSLISLNESDKPGNAECIFSALLKGWDHQARRVIHLAPLSSHGLNLELKTCKWHCRAFLKIQPAV